MRKTWLYILLCLLPVKLFAWEEVPVYRGYMFIEDMLIPGLELRDLTAFVTVINREDLLGTYHDVSEALEEVVGVRINRFGGLGNFSTMSIRGSSGDQVMVYLDGVLLNKSSGGNVDLSMIPMENIDHIEVFRGMTPSALGAASLGGVINIVTRKARSSSITSLKTGWGSYETGTGSFHYSPALDSKSFLVNLDFQRSKGDFTFLDDNGTPYNQDDDEHTRRKNNDFYAGSLLTKYGIHSNSGTSIEFSNIFYAKDQGIPGIGNYQSSDAKLKTIRNIFSMKLFQPGILGNNVNLKTTLFTSYLRQSFTDMKGEIGVGSQKNRNLTWTIGGNARISYTGMDRNFFTMFAELRYESFTPYNEYYDPVKGSTNSRVALTLTLEDEIELARDKWLINPSIRFDYYRSNVGNPEVYLYVPQDSERDTWDFFVGGKIGTRYRFGENISLQANVGKFYRIPDFAEMYGNRGYIVGNPNLEPEKSINADLGIDYSREHLWGFRKFSFTCSYFLRGTENLIQYIQNSQSTAIAQNLESALVHGLELTMETKLPGSILFIGNYTLQLSRDTSNIVSRKGKRLPNTPVNELNLKLRYGIWKGNLEYKFTYISSNYLDRANLVEVPHRFFHGLAYKFPLVKHWKILLEGKNLTNNQVEDYRGYPLPGRTFFINLETRF